LDLFQNALAFSCTATQGFDKASDLFVSLRGSHGLRVWNGWPPTGRKKAWWLESPIHTGAFCTAFSRTRKLVTFQRKLVAAFHTSFHLNETSLLSTKTAVQNAPVFKLGLKVETFASRLEQRNKVMVHYTCTCAESFSFSQHEMEFRLTNYCACCPHCVL
jgi:hypothetical protein